MAPNIFRLTYMATLLAAISPTIAWSDLSDSTLRSLPPVGDSFNIHTGSLLAPILTPRVPGTPGSLKVLSHFQNFFSTHLPLWNTTTQNSTSTTPLSNGAKIPFVNFIATRDPPWSRQGDVGRLVLVAHYDSKISPEGFIGATDSAVPCALLMHVARAIDEALSRKWERMRESGVGGDEWLGGDGGEEERGVMIVFLDGEEAFKEWTDEDSLYGARNLAETWESTLHPPLSTRQSHLSNIDLFLLLDLLGSSSPQIPSYYKTTHWAYTHFSTLETRLRSPALNLFKSHAASPKKWFFEPEKKADRFNGWMVADDHIPFLSRGVEVLHVIPTPFPRVWHELSDDGEHLDAGTVDDWGVLVTAFVAGWLGLEGFFEEVVAAADGAAAGAAARVQKRGIRTEL